MCVWLPSIEYGVWIRFVRKYECSVEQVHNNIIGMKLNWRKKNRFYLDCGEREREREGGRRRERSERE